MFFLSSKRVRSVKISSIVTVISNCMIFSTDYIFNNVLSTHHIERINILLGKEFDPLGAGYNLIQSKIAIDLGDSLEKDFLNGTQTRFDFVPDKVPTLYFVH